MQHHVLLTKAIRVHVDTCGDGKTLVLVHGLGGPLMWQKVVPLLESSYHVVVIHLPGFGRSDKPEASYSIQYFAETLSEVLPGLIKGQCSVAGISLGGRIAAEYALREPERVHKLVLISSAGLSGAAPMLRNLFLWKLFSVAAERIFLRNKWLMCKSAERSYYDTAARPAGLCDEYFKQMDAPGGRRAWLSAMKNTVTRDDDFAGRLRLLPAPTLIVWGEKDRTIAVKDAFEFHEKIHESSLVVIPRCAHSVPLEKPVELAEEIRRFLG